MFQTHKFGNLAKLSQNVNQLLNEMSDAQIDKEIE